VYTKLNPPPAILRNHEKEVSEVEQFFKARKLKTSKTKRDKLDRYLRKAIETWDEGSGTMRARLRELNDFFEGKKEDVDFPFGSGQSSSLDVRLAAAKARTLRASFNRVTFADNNPFVAEILPGAKREDEDNLAEAHVNWSIVKETNGLDALKDTPIPCFRDGTALVYGEWERRVERGVEYKSYATTDEFIADYPEAEDAGIEEEKYQEILAALVEPESEVHVEYEVDFVAQNEPVYTVFPLAKFVWYPLAAKDLRTSAEVYGYHRTQGDKAFGRAVAQGFYDSEPSEECRRKSGADRDAWDASRDAIEGIEGEDNNRASYRIAKLVVSYDLDQDKVPERFMVWYDMDANKSLRIERYGLYRNTPNVIPFRFIGRDGRFIGVSQLDNGLDLFREINALHRHRSNVRRLTDSVTLIMPKKLKEDVDLGAEYAEFKPGMTIWVPDDVPADKYPKQLQIFNTSRSNDSMDEESLVARYLDGLIGVSEGQSGRETPIDPGAPAAKTAMLLQRADFRIEDLVDEWRRSVSSFVDLHNALYHQNAGSSIKFMRNKGGKQEEAKIRTAVLADPRRKFELKAVKQTIAPEYEMNKVMAIVAAAFQMKFPVSAKPEMIVEAWNDYVTASRIPMPERFHIEMSAQGPMMGGQPIGAPASLGAPAGGGEGILNMIRSMAAGAGQPTKPATK